MNSHATEKFWKAFQNLPLHIQHQAREAYQLWKQNPYHPSLRFKKVHASEPIYSVRVSVGWRAVGIKSDDAMVTNTFI